MSQILNGSICLSDIPKDKMTKSEKNGKVYVNVNIYVNDEADQFGNDGSISVTQSKQEREQKVKRVYIGNVKKPAFTASAPSAAQQTDASNFDLPF